LKASPRTLARDSRGGGGGLYYRLGFVSLFLGPPLQVLVSMAFSMHKRLGPSPQYFGLAPPDSRGPRDDA
jgi:hypothetical protein